MASINFKININSKNEHTKIYVRFRGDKFDCETPTNIVINKKEWSESKQKLKSTASNDNYRNDINNKLDELKSKINNQYNIDYSQGASIDTTWLKEVINNFHNQPTNNAENNKSFLTTAASNYISGLSNKRNKRTGLPLNIRTIQDYENSLKKLILFEEWQKKKVKLDSTDLNFYDKFTEYLRVIDILGENTIGGIITNIKTFLSFAEIKGLKVHQAFKTSDFYSPSFKPEDIYFNESEIDEIRKHPFKKDGYLDNARDWLIIGVWTGLRVSDLLHITKKDIKNNFIDNKNFKTKIPVTIPIHPYVEEILKKRNGDFPREINEQNFNDYIKLVAKEVGFTEKIKGSKMTLITDEKGEPKLNQEGEKMYRKKPGIFHKYELVTTHICRRSFASNLYGKIDTLTIMKITGHQTEKQFLEYIKITPKHHAKKLSELWAELYKT